MDLPTVILEDGTQKWYKKNKLHRDNDLPAVILSDGTQEWYKEGKLHRDNDLPAVILSCYIQIWYKEGKIHRDNDLPAVIEQNDSEGWCNKEWYKEGKLHRDDDLPAVIRNDYRGKYKIWYKEGKLHRDNDLPAYINKTYDVIWYNNGEKIKVMSREKYDKLLRLYPAVQLYRVKSAKEKSSFYKKWNKSKILEPLLTGMIIGYM